MRKHHFAAIAASILFCAAFALATGIDQNPVQTIYAVILMAASAALFRYAERRGAKRKKQCTIHNSQLSASKAA